MLQSSCAGAAERKVALRLAFMVSLTSMDHLRVMERWPASPHNADTTGRVGHTLDRYLSGPAAPMPDGEDAAEWGFDNWRVTGLWWHTSPMEIATGLGERWGKAPALEDPPSLRWVVAHGSTTKV